MVLLLASLSKFAAVNPYHEALDEQVVVRVLVDDELHVGGLDSLAIDPGCTDTFALVLDASDDSNLSPMPGESEQS